MSSSSPAATLRDRLALCHAEVTGITTSIKEYAHMPAVLGLPVVAHGVLGFDVVTGNTSIFEGTFTLLAQVYVAEIFGDLDDADGSQARQLTTTLMDRFIAYHNQNPRLATSTLDALEGVSHPIRIACRQTILTTQSKKSYMGFQLQFTIQYENYIS